MPAIRQEKPPRCDHRATPRQITAGAAIALSSVWFRRFCSSMALTMRLKLNKSPGDLWQIIARDQGNWF